MSEIYKNYKKGLFSNKLYAKVDGKNVPIKFPKKSKVKIKVGKNSFSIVLPNGEHTEEFDDAKFNENNKNIIHISSNDSKYSSMLIDCLTGVCTPVCENIWDKKHYVVQKDTKKIYKISYENGLQVEETNFVLKSINHGEYIICEDNLGNKLILNSEDLSVIKNLGPIEDEEMNISEHDYDLKILNYGNKKYLIHGDEVFAEFECNKIEYGSVYGEHSKGLLRIFDEASNKTKMIIYDSKDPKSFETIDLDYKSYGMIKVEDKILFVCQNEQGKWGVVDQNQKVVIPFDYDDIDCESLNKNYNEEKMVFAVEKNGKKGVMDLDGKEILPCEYSNIDFRVSAVYEDEMRFLAQNENNLWGIVNSNGKIESDFVYEHNSHYCSYDQIRSKLSDENKYYTGLKIENIKTKKVDYLVIQNKDCIIKADDAVIKYYSSESESKPKTKEIQIDKYSDEEIATAAFASAIIFDSPIAGIVTAKIMSEKKETKTVEVTDTDNHEF